MFDDIAAPISKTQGLRCDIGEPFVYVHSLNPKSYMCSAEHLIPDGAKLHRVTLSSRRRLPVAMETQFAAVCAVSVECPITAAVFRPPHH